MKNVVIISSTPRVGGNSEILSEEFARGAREAGHNVEIIYLRDYKIGYCIGCYACENLGKCFQNDGANEIAEKMTRANVLVFATPVYFYSMSGQLKVLIDRMTPFYEKIKADIYMLATMWDTDASMMKNTFEAIRGFTRDCLEGCKEKGVLIGSGISGRGAVNTRPDYLKKAYDMGRNC